MALKNAALLALIGTIPITALLVWDFVFNVLNVLRGVILATMLFSSFIYAFACFSAEMVMSASEGIQFRQRVKTVAHAVELLNFVQNRLRMHRDTQPS